MTLHHPVSWVISAKEPSIIWLFCGKRPIKMPYLDKASYRMPYLNKYGEIELIWEGGEGCQDGEGGGRGPEDGEIE